MQSTAILTETLHGTDLVLGSIIPAKTSVGIFVGSVLLSNLIVGVDVGITETGSADGEEVGSGVTGAGVGVAETGSIDGEEVGSGVTGAGVGVAETGSADGEEVGPGVTGAALAGASVIGPGFTVVSVVVAAVEARESVVSLPLSSSKDFSSTIIESTMTAS